ncbi:dnaj homolog subfamily c member 9-like [Nannochloropsis oceanica]
MSSPQAQINQAFGTKKTLYEILGVPADATVAVIRKAYFKMALTCHPDKCPDDPGANARFQALSIIHATLSDDDKRRSYDETGEVESEDVELKQSEQEWYEYWRELFPTVTVDKIKKFQGEYQGSEEEKGDVLKAYKEGQGKMSWVIDNVMLATDQDEERFREMIEGAIAAKEVKRLKGFKADVLKDAKRKKRAEKEAKEAEELLRAIHAKRGVNALATMATDRRNQMSSFYDSLEEKYGKKGGNGGGGGENGRARIGKKRKAKKEEEEGGEEKDIDDEEFERIRASLGRNEKVAAAGRRSDKMSE